MTGIMGAKVVQENERPVNGTGWVSFLRGPAPAAAGRPEGANDPQVRYRVRVHAAAAGRGRSKAPWKRAVRAPALAAVRPLPSAAPVRLLRFSVRVPSDDAARVSRRAFFLPA